MTKIALIRERKQPADRRVALSPPQVKQALKRWPALQIWVEKSPERVFPDSAYEAAGAILVERATEADILLGIKEVPVNELMAHKTYLFFSHTIKKQPYNQKLLQKILANNIRMIDYECLSWPKGDRILGFGRWAGIVGAYNAMLVWGRKYGAYELKPAHGCKDYQELRSELKKAQLPAIKIALTGSGRVASGSLEIMAQLGIREVRPAELRNAHFNEPVFALLENEHLYSRKDGKAWNRSDFFANHDHYEGIFQPYLSHVDMLINGMYWEDDMDALFQKADTAKSDFRMRVIADITCDVEGSVPITMRATPINDPVFGWDGTLQQTTAPYLPDTIDVMAVTNLPAELPSSASEEFGDAMLQHILPLLIEGDRDRILERATLTHMNRTLTPDYEYLKDYAAGNDEPAS